MYGYIVLHDDILGLWCLDRTHRIHIHKFRFLQSALKLLFFKAVSRIIMACKARASDGCIHWWKGITSGREPEFEPFQYNM